MRARLLSIAVAAVLIAGCATTTRLDAGKGLAGAWAALDAAAQASDVAVKAGRLKGQRAAVVSADLKKAQSAMLAADAAYHISGSDPTTNILVATAAVAEITTILDSAP